VATWKTCAGIAKHLGLAPSTFAFVCDQFFFLHDALEHASTVSATAMAQGLDALGGGFHSASAPGTDFGPGVAMGVSSVRELTYETKCHCFLYTSGPIPIH
jgi:hypothetical protein